MRHFSWRSCKEIKKYFQVTFSDSKITDSFKLVNTKCGYFINFLILPYFKMNLIKKVNSSPFFSCSFDESFSRISQDEQMDTYVRNWYNEKGLVKTNYLDTQFLMRSNADNLHKRLAALGDILEQMLQLSIDGPNLNWRVLDLLNSFREEKEWNDFLYLGSCRLLAIHAVFQTGLKAAKWDIAKVFRSMW